VRAGRATRRRYHPPGRTAVFLSARSPLQGAARLVAPGTRYPPRVLTFVIFAVLAVIIAVAWYFSDEQKTKRAIRAARPVSIAEAKAGEVVKLSGDVKYLGETVRAPLSGRTCAYYQVTVEEYRSNGKGGSWVTVLTDPGGVDFLVEDRTGRARVKNLMLKVVAVQDAKYESGTFNDATPALEEYLAAHGMKSKGWVFNKSMRYQEAVFEEGETVSIVGQISYEHDPGAMPEGSGYRETPKRAVIAAPDGGFLLASDDPKLVLP
jgi:hypothetical protein